MKGRTRRYYRVRLVAYDVIPSSYWHLPPRLASPSPTPLVFFIRSQRRFLHKVHLVRLQL
ncbi:hypothetical protein EPA93_21420 [Ktedonosporobacter rubrisoli]|uniref:Uncharacterized protein n=1 Tax=Ktedonosporobacter rubrisoli TaxID=2509675 RepID=A0A4P6JU19_KTERU|nr:hypothetical protein [Ktedonosporobacter rubrisoli]QBD78416.1 hypothetical protein EPA93_21420 [Ktedonosporobacter rubrisoli]